MLKLLECGVGVYIEPFEALVNPSGTALTRVHILEVLLDFGRSCTCLVYSRDYIATFILELDEHGYNAHCVFTRSRSHIDKLWWRCGENSKIYQFLYVEKK